MATSTPDGGGQGHAPDSRGALRREEGSATTWWQCEEPPGGIGTPGTAADSASPQPQLRSLSGAREEPPGGLCAPGLQCSQQRASSTSSAGPEKSNTLKK